MKRFFVALSVVVALMMVVYLPKVEAARKYKSYSKTVVKSSGPVVEVPVVSQSWSSSSRMSSSGGHWERVWVPDAPIVSSSVKSSSTIVANPVRVQQKSYSHSYSSSGGCPQGGCPQQSSSRSYRKSKTKSYSRSW